MADQLRHQLSKVRQPSIAQASLAVWSHQAKQPLAPACPKDAGEVRRIFSTAGCTMVWQGVLMGSTPTGSWRAGRFPATDIAGLIFSQLDGLRSDL
jgi:hypothetical protein